MLLFIITHLFNIYKFFLFVGIDNKNSFNLNFG